MTLTVGILCCDQDVDKLPSFICEVREKVQVDYEILVWDNTEKRNLPKLDDDIAVMSTEKKVNYAQFVGRREIARNARGTWLWFVDPDDHLEECITSDSIAPFAEDGVEWIIFQFRNLATGRLYGIGDDWSAVKGRKVITQDMLFESTVDVVWNKWFNTQALLDAYTPLNNINAKVSVHEDTLLCFMFLAEPRVTAVSTQVIYQYDDAASTAGNNGRANTVERFTNYVSGLLNVMCMIHLVFPNTEVQDKTFMAAYGKPLEIKYPETATVKMVQSIIADPEHLNEYVDALCKELQVGEVMDFIRSARSSLSFTDLVAWADLEDKVCKRVALHKDFRVTICLHPDCNLACPYCNRKEAMANEPRFSDDEMVGRFKHVLDKLHTLLPFGFAPQIMGGEPACWSQDFNEKIAKLLEPFPKYIVFTNGTDRDNFWYKQEKAWTVTHVTDWKEKMESYVPVTERDCPVVVVTHKDMDFIEDYLKVNKNWNLQFAPCDGAGAEWDITNEDAAKLVALQQKYKLYWVAHTGLDAPDIEGSDRCNMYLNPPWQVDCATYKAVTCTKSRNWVDLDDLSQDTAISCMGCKLTAF